MGMFDNAKKRVLLGNFTDQILQNIQEFKEGGLIKSWVIACTFSTKDLLDYLFLNKEIDRDLGYNPFRQRITDLNQEKVNKIYKIFAFFSLAMFLHGNDGVCEKFGLTKEKFENSIISIFEFNKKEIDNYQTLKNSLKAGEIISNLYDLIFKDGLEINNFEEDSEILQFKITMFPTLMEKLFLTSYNSMLLGMLKTH